MEPNAFATVGARTIEAREELTSLARLPDHDERKMAQIGETALFEEALLGALRSHLSELKIVAR